MKTSVLKIMIFVLLSLFIWMTPAFATNWVFAENRPENYEGLLAKEYIDADNVVMDGSSLFFWQLSVYYKTDEHNIRYKSLWQIEVKLDLNPHKWRHVFTCNYYPDGREIPHMKSTEPNMFRNAWPGEFWDIIINTALKYAKPGKNQVNEMPPHL